MSGSNTRKRWKRWAAVLSLAIACTLGVLKIGSYFLFSHGIGDMSPKDFDLMSRFDMDQVRHSMKGLKKVVDYASQRPKIWSASTIEELDPNEKDEVLQIWASFLDHMVTLDAIKNVYKPFYTIPYITEQKRHSTAFGIFFTAFLCQMREGFRFILLTQDKNVYETLLDEPSRKYGTTGGTYGDLKYDILHLEDFTGLFAGMDLHDNFNRQHMIKDESTKWMAEYIDATYPEVKNFLKAEGAGRLAMNASDIAGESLFNAFFPVQKKVAEVIGDTRFKSKKNNLITAAQVYAMVPQLKPGDIIVERRNWFLSNIGLPGFWPHAALYVGRPEDVARLDEDEAVRAYYKEHGASGLMDFIQTTYPDAWSAWHAKTEDGHYPRVIEAISEGVLLTSIEHACIADYVGVMRTTLPNVAIARALGRAFSHHNKPYDFNFDFISDSTIVCSELVYKAYRPGDGVRGLNIKMIDLLGRQVLPPTEFIKKLDSEWTKENRQLEFVYFLDGREETKNAIINDSAALRVSHQRPKWDILQK